MKAKVKATGEIVEVYHESQHGQAEIIYKEAVFVNGRIWTENELEFFQDKSPRKAKIGGMLKSMLDNMDEDKLAKTREELANSSESCKDLEEAGKEWLRPQLDKSYEKYGENKMMELTHFDGYSMLEAIEFGVKWKEEQFEKNSKEPVSEDFEKEIDCAHRIFYDEVGWDSDEGARAYVADWFAHYFANWQKHRMEVNRIKHCNSISKEQAELEQKFLDEHLDKYNRMPTFLDAIEYGMRLQKEQMVASAHEHKVKVDAGGYPYIPQMELYDYEKDIPLAKEGDKYKIILIKED